MHNFDTLTLNPVADSSHDLKTLANGVLCMSALLEKTPLSIEQSEIVELLKKSAAELSNLTNQILIQSQRPTETLSSRLEVFSLKDVIETTFDTFDLTFLNKGLDNQLVIKGNLPAKVKGDRVALHRILANLLHNAGKFTENGGIKLTVSLHRMMASEVTLIFKIEDTGIGIAPENMPFIFDRFSKFDSDGHGLGLSNVKSLVTQNGGKIDAKSQVNVGTTFIVSMPFQQVALPLTQNAHFAHWVFDGKKILIADDDAVYTKYLTTILAEKRVQLTTVQTASEALQCVENQHFDLILLDLNLPDATGYDLANMIQESYSPNRHTPLVGMTAAAVHAMDFSILGFSDVFQKPLNTEGVVLKLHSILSQSKKSEIGNEIISAPKTYTLASPFDAQLDVAHLTALYGGDTEHAVLMFETFLEESLIDFYQLFNLLKINDLEGIKRLIHRFKPAFSMVGLTEIEGQLFDLEQNLHHYSMPQVFHFLKKVEQKIQDYTPILKKQLKNLKRLKYVDALNAA